MGAGVLYVATQISSRSVTVTNMLNLNTTINHRIGTKIDYRRGRSVSKYEVVIYIWFFLLLILKQFIYYQVTRYNKLQQDGLIFEEHTSFNIILLFFFIYLLILVTSAAIRPLVLTYIVITHVLLNSYFLYYVV